MEMQVFAAAVVPVWLDGTWDGGTDEQEDELDDVRKGVLDPPTNDEGAGEIVESNKVDPGLMREYEKAGVELPEVDAAEEKKRFPGF